MAANAFAPLRDNKYIDLVTYRKSGAPVHTPVWFAEHGGKLYVMTRDDSGKAKRIRNNPQIEVAPSTIRGKRTGPGIAGKAQIAIDADAARRLIRKKYLLARLPIWSANNIYLELRPD